MHSRRNGVRSLGARARAGAAALAALAAAAACLAAVPEANAQIQPRPSGPRTPKPTPAGGAAAAQPAAPKNGDAHAVPEVTPESDEVTLSVFSEPVELTTLVEYVSKALGLNVTIKGSLPGSVVFNAPVSVPKSRLLKLLDALLEQQNFTITFDPDSQFYTVHPTSEVSYSTGGQAPSTRIIPTPNVRPSYLKPAIDSQFFGQTAAVGAPVQPGQTPISKGVAYVDELGVIVVTESPRRVAAIEDFVRSLLERYDKSEYIRLELRHVAAPQARFRALQLVGQTTGQQAPTINPQTGEAIQQNTGIGLGQSRGIDNLSERLTVDPLGNALIFRGIAEEIDQVRKILEIIDAPNTLKPEEYEVGSRAKQIADIARLRGLGEVTLISAPQQNNPNQPFPVFVNGNDGLSNTQQRATPSAGGPVMVIDEKNGTIVYYGTQEQHAALRELISKLNVEDERVGIKAYKLKHSDAEQIAELILNLIQNTKPLGAAPLLAEGGAGTTGAGTTTRTNYRPRSASRSATPVTGTAGGAGGGGADEGLVIGGEEAFVLPDKGNNQVIVKAPGREQKEFARLIESLDQRKPQVFIEAKIVAVTSTYDFRLAFETQLINANGTGGIFNTNFGLSSIPNTGTQPVLNPKTVAAGLQGLTSALIKSDQVPIIMTALATDSDTHILSTPQVLVDDNVEATVTSVQQQPTTTTTQTTGNPTQTSFGEYVEAGTTFTVTPHISAGGYLRMEYKVNLSNFQGTGSNGIPPPKLDNTLESKSVTVPSNMTVVIGGLVLDTKGRTVIKVPLLGDIPIVGALFRDDNRNDRQTTLYIFITPRILQDPTFDDYLLLTKGPQASVKLPLDIPALTPSIMEPTMLPVTRPASTPTPTPGAPAPVEPARQDPAVPLLDAPAPRAPAPVEGKQTPTAGGD